MVFVSVGYYLSPYSFFIFFEPAGFGNQKIHARHIFGRERIARVDDYYVVAVFERGHVLADFPDAAEETDFQSAFIFQFSLRSDLSFC